MSIAITDPDQNVRTATELLVKLTMVSIGKLCKIYSIISFCQKLIYNIFFIDMKNGSNHYFLEHCCGAAFI